MATSGIGTAKGLMRLDGASFIAFTADNTTGMSGDDISFNMLWGDDAGILWAGTYGHGVIRNDHGHLSTIGKEQGLPDPAVLRVDSDEQGGVWMYTTVASVAGKTATWNKSIQSKTVQTWDLS